MTPCVRTGSIVPNGGTAGGARFIETGIAGFDSRLVGTGVGAGADFGTASSTNKLCVGLACDCGSTTDAFACTAPPFVCELEVPFVSQILPTVPKTGELPVKSTLR